MLLTCPVSIRCALLTLCFVSIQACVTPSPLATKLPPEAVSGEPAPGAARYTIDPSKSQLTIRVYREGPLARLGHNHIISTRAIRGEIFVADPLENSSLSLAFDVNDLIVDDKSLRAVAGPNFESEVSEKDRTGTRDNMLSTPVLDVSNYPEISVRSLTVTGAVPELTLGVEIGLRGTGTQISIPVRVDIVDDHLAAHSAFSVSQTELGMQPFSVMMGALRVKDQLDLEINVIAYRQ